MTRSDKKDFIRKTQAQIIDSYSTVFQAEKHKAIEINGMQKSIEIADDLKKQVLQMIT